MGNPLLKDDDFVKTCKDNIKKNQIDYLASSIGSEMSAIFMETGKDVTKAQVKELVKKCCENAGVTNEDKMTKIFTQVITNGAVSCTLPDSDKPSSRSRHR